MKLPKFICIMFAVIAISSWFVPVASAQEAAAEQPTIEAASSAPGESVTLMQLIKEGGWTMWPLGLCSVLFVGFTIYNAIRIRAARLLRPDLVEQLRIDLESLNIESARTICLSAPCLITNIVHAGLMRIKEDEVHIASIEKAMEEASTEEITTRLGPINYISIIAVISPMLGLLGTVSGMIKAFRTISMGGMGRPELFAGNISEALVTTATGLIIGIPAMITYFYFKNRYTQIVSQIGRITGLLLDSLNLTARGAQEVPESYDEMVDETDSISL